jgi:hypothetical protein
MRDVEIMSDKFTIAKPFSKLTSSFQKENYIVVMMIMIIIIIIIILRGGECFLRSRQSLSYLRTFQHFMDSKGSLPCSQELSTGWISKGEICDM